MKWFCPCFQSFLPRSALLFHIIVNWPIGSQTQSHPFLCSDKSGKFCLDDEHYDFIFLGARSFYISINFFGLFANKYHGCMMKEWESPFGDSRGSNTTHN